MTDRLIAFTGLSRSGKSSAADLLGQTGYTRVAMGDIIKAQLDQLVWREMGFSAFTELDAHKKLIRPLLECWGDVNYDAIFGQFMRDLPSRAVNSRLCRLAEAKAWKERGGIICTITRVCDDGSPWPAATKWEADVLADITKAGLVDVEVVNDGTCGDLLRTIYGLFVTGTLYFRSGSRVIRCRGAASAGDREN